MPLALGAAVLQTVIPIAGFVADIKYDAQAGSFAYLVEYIDADGNPSQRWFKESEVGSVS